ncbi:hypothetical protein [Reichenbachiella versicolor]|uniref:hypothetical protein n=1 Tax=Reichenbachiella versicolor TaxID=1821036 RepID=UPI000D6E1DA1|nr:hypothetical protein [Reichenbachiella versicolor]
MIQMLVISHNQSHIDDVADYLKGSQLVSNAIVKLRETARHTNNSQDKYSENLYKLIVKTEVKLFAGLEKRIQRVFPDHQLKIFGRRSRIQGRKI